MSVQSAAELLDPETGSREEADASLDTSGPWVVILYNCDCHTFPEVVGQLMKATSCGLRKAWSVAIEAHSRGRAIAFTGEQGPCERVAAVLRAIRLQVETDRF